MQCCHSFHTFTQSIRFVQRKWERNKQKTKIKTTFTDCFYFSLFNQSLQSGFICGFFFIIFRNFWLSKFVWPVSSSCTNCGIFLFPIFFFISFSGRFFLQLPSEVHVHELCFLLIYVCVCVCIGCDSSSQNRFFLVTLIAWRRCDSLECFSIFSFFLFLFHDT